MEGGPHSIAKGIKNIAINKPDSNEGKAKSKSSMANSGTKDLSTSYGKKHQNFLSKFRDKDSKKFRNFTAAQFLEVWNHYDQDRMLNSYKCYCLSLITP